MYDHSPAATSQHLLSILRVPTAYAIALRPESSKLKIHGQKLAACCKALYICQAMLQQASGRTGDGKEPVLCLDMSMHHCSQRTRLLSLRISEEICSSCSLLQACLRDSRCPAVGSSYLGANRVARRQCMMTGFPSLVTTCSRRRAEGVRGQVKTAIRRAAPCSLGSWSSG